jgi:hypothetical protein
MDGAMALTEGRPLVASVGVPRPPLGTDGVAGVWAAEGTQS